MLFCYKSVTVRDRRVVTVYINGKPYMESHMRPSHIDLERSKSRSLRFQILKPYISQRNRVRPYVAISINRKAYTGSPLMQVYLTSVTLKGQCQGRSDIEGLYFSVQCHFGVVRCT